MDSRSRGFRLHQRLKGKVTLEDVFLFYRNADDRTLEFPTLFNVAKALGSLPQRSVLSIFAQTPENGNKAQMRFDAFFKSALLYFLAITIRSIGHSSLVQGLLLKDPEVDLTVGYSRMNVPGKLPEENVEDVWFTGRNSLVKEYFRPDRIERLVILLQDDRVHRLEKSFERFFDMQSSEIYKKRCEAVTRLALEFDAEELFRFKADIPAHIFNHLMFPNERSGAGAVVFLSHNQKASSRLKGLEMMMNLYRDGFPLLYASDYTLNGRNNCPQPLVFLHKLLLNTHEDVTHFFVKEFHLNRLRCLRTSVSILIRNAVNVHLELLQEISVEAMEDSVLILALVASTGDENLFKLFFDVMVESESQRQRLSEYLVLQWKENKACIRSIAITTEDSTVECKFLTCPVIAAIMMNEHHVARALLDFITSRVKSEVVADLENCCELTIMELKGQPIVKTKRLNPLSSPRTAKILRFFEQCQHRV